MPALWSQVAVSQSAASAAGSDPPITKPKKRPPVVTTRPGSTRARAARRRPRVPRRSGSGPPSAATSSAIATDARPPWLSCPSEVGLGQLRRAGEQPPVRGRGHADHRRDPSASAARRRLSAADAACVCCTDGEPGQLAERRRRVPQRGHEQLQRLRRNLHLPPPVAPARPERYAGHRHPGHVCRGRDRQVRGAPPAHARRASAAGRALGLTYSDIGI